MGILSFFIGVGIALLVMPRILPLIMPADDPDE